MSVSFSGWIVSSLGSIISYILIITMSLYSVLWVSSQFFNELCNYLEQTQTIVSVINFIWRQHRTTIIILSIQKMKVIWYHNTLINMTMLQWTCNILQLYRVHLFSLFFASWPYILKVSKQKLRHLFNDSIVLN